MTRTQRSAVDATIERELATALGYRCISQGFRYPDADDLSALRELLAALEQALPLLDETGSLQQLCGEAASLLRSASPEQILAQHVSLFGHTAHGPCPPYECEYGQSTERLQQPHEISDLCAFYRAFGLEKLRDIGERPDFLPVECEFAAFLCRKVVFGEDNGDADLAGIARDARRSFLRQHLACWTPTFAGLLLRESETGFYPAFTRLAVALIRSDATRIDAQPKDARLRLRVPEEPPGSHVHCGLTRTSPTMEV